MTDKLLNSCLGLFRHLLNEPAWVVSKDSLEAYNEHGLGIPKSGPGSTWEVSTFSNYKLGEDVMIIQDPNAFLASIPGEAGEYLRALYTAHLMGSDEPCP